MANAVIGALRVVLGADTAALETGLKNSQSKLAGFGASAAKAGAVAAAAFAAAGVAAGASIKNAIDQADELGKTAQKIGIPVEELSGLKHAADLSGVSMEALEKSAARLSRTMVEAVARPTSEAGVAFRALGLSVRNADGSMKTTGQVISDVAGKFGNMQDGATKTKLAMDLFGRSGADLIPMLNAGKTGLASMIMEARQLGLVITTDTAKAAESFNDNLSRLGGVLRGVVLQSMAAMAPALAHISQRMVEAAKNSGLVQTISAAVAAAFEGVARGALLVADNIGAIARIAALFAGVQLASTVATMGLAFVKFAAAIRTTGIALAAFTAIKNISLKGFLLIGGIVALATGQMENFQNAIKGVGEKVASILPAGLSKQAAKIAESMGLNISALTADLTKLAAGTDVARSKQDQHNQAMINAQKALAAIAAASAEAALKTQGLALIQQSLPMWQQYQLELAKTEAAMRAAGATQEQLAAGAAKVAERYGFTWQAASSSIVGSLGEMSSAMGTENKKMLKIAQVAGAAQALMATMTGAAEALKLGFPFNLVAAAAVIAKGMGFVAAIKGTSVGGFATGGSFTVPGSGGPDSKRVMMDLTPGEQVDIWRPSDGGQDPRGGAGGGHRREVVVNFNGLVGRAGIERLFEEINSALGDGLRLRMNPGPA